MTSLEIKTLKDQQAVLRSVLMTLDEIVSESSLRYCCAYGTALGAVRHSDLIPWDSDCDVVIPIDDLDSLVELLAERLIGSGISVHDVSVEPGYDHLFPRLSVDAVDQNVLHVDLFPLVGTFRRLGLAQLHLRTSKLLRQAYLFKRSDARERYNHDPRKRLIAQVVGCVMMIIPNRLFVRAWKVITRLRPLDGQRPVLSIGGPYGVREIGDYATFFPPSFGLVGGRRIALPGDVDGYLSGLYGDYMEPPNSSQIASEEAFFYEVTLPKIKRCLSGECGHAAHTG